MNFVDKYGWDKYKKQGIKELEKIRDSDLLKGNDEIKDLLNRYIGLYKNHLILSKKDISGKILYPELVSDKYAKPSYDKASGAIKELRKFLDEFYKTEEGIQSQYRIFFIADERDHRLGIKKIEIDEYRKTEEFQSVKPSLVNSSLVNLIKINPKIISEKILNFISDIFIIAFQAVFKAPNLALRVSEMEKIGNDKNRIIKEGIKLFLIFTFFWLLLIVFTNHVLKTLEIQLMNKYQINFFSKYFEMKYKQIDHLLSFPENFLSALRFVILAVVIPWLVYKVFKFKVAFLTLSAFQLYFLWSWIFVFAFLFWLAINSRLGNMNIVLSILTTVALIWYLIMHFKGLCTLYNLSLKKGILQFILTFILTFLLLNSI